MPIRGEPKVKTMLQITGLAAQTAHDLVIDSGLRIQRHKSGSFTGSSIRNVINKKVGEIIVLRSGITVRVDPTIIPPSILATLVAKLS